MKRNKNKAPKQRDPFVQHIRFRKSGAHQKSKKALRRKEKVQLQKQYA